MKKIFFTRQKFRKLIPNQDKCFNSWIVGSPKICTFKTVRFHLYNCLYNCKTNIKRTFYFQIRKKNTATLAKSNSGIFACLLGSIYVQYIVQCTYRANLVILVTNRCMYSYYKNNIHYTKYFAFFLLYTVPNTKLNIWVRHFLLKIFISEAFDSPGPGDFKTVFFIEHEGKQAFLPSYMSPVQCDAIRTEQFLRLADSVNISYREECSILHHIHITKYVQIFFIVIFIFYNDIRKCILTYDFLVVKCC